MLAFLRTSLLLAGCSAGTMSAAQHEQLAHHYEATAASIETECAKARRNELTVGDVTMCWKDQDRRFLDANLHAAERHRTEAAKLRDQSAMR
jgi:hypothetical protein